MAIKPRKMWEFMKMNTKKFDQVRMGDKTFDLKGPLGYMKTEDKGLAQAIHQRFGVSKYGTGDLIMNEVDSDKLAIEEPGHTYFFGTSRRYAEAWERIFGKRNK
jgi:hypothetical protein